MTAPPENLPKCPNCGAEVTSTMEGAAFFKCGGDTGVVRTSDCYERELAALREQLARARDGLAAIIEIKPGMSHPTAKAGFLAANELARETLNEITK